MGQLAGDHVQVLVDGYDLTGDHNKIAIQDSRTMLEAAAFGDAVQKFITGQRKASLEHNGYMNAAAARSHPVLKSAEVSGVVSVLLGQNAAPAVGDPVYSLASLQGKYNTLPEAGKVIPFSATFANRGLQGGWGVALAVGATFTNTTTGSGVDNGASTANGGAAHLHILTNAASDTYTIIVEGASNSGFSSGLVTLATFTLNASAKGSERIAISGTIPRYTRWKATRTGTAGDTVKIAVSLVRF
jgi:hypothetical protein